MKNEAVKLFAGNHARLFKKRSFFSKPRNQSRAVDRTHSNDNLSAEEFGSSSTSSTHNLNLRAEKDDRIATTSHPSSHTQTNAHAHSTPFGASSTFTHAATPTAEIDSNASPVSGVAIGIALGLIGLAGLVIGVVWYIRKGRNAGNRPIPRWKRDPFALGAGVSSTDVAKRPDTVLGFPKNSNRKSEGYAQLEDEKASSLLSPVTEKGSVHTDTHSSFLAQSMVIAPPSSTLNNPSRPVSTVTLQRNSSKTGELAKVHRSFLPTLPDELQIHQGEMIEIISAFDDGWALCMNRHGEKGVVPLECLTTLSNKNGLSPEDGSKEQNRLSKRASSLYAGVPAGSY